MAGESWGQRLRRLIGESDHNQSTLAVAAGVSPAYVSDLVHGRRDAVSLPVARRMAVALDVSLTELEAPVRMVATTRELVDQGLIREEATDGD